MKKVLTMLAAIAVSASSLNASATDGNIDFTGEISSQTCTIEGTTTGSAAKTVNLPRVSTSSLSTVGKTAGRTGFTIALTACTGTSALVRFEQRSGVDATTGNLVNQTAAGSNVQVQILNANYSPINLQTNDGSLSTTITTKAANLQFYAQYIAATAVATAGKVTSNVQFSMDYN